MRQVANTRSGALRLVRFAKAAKRDSIAERLPALRLPTLLVWGKNDPSAVLPGGLALFDMVAASANRAQMHIFNKAGHYSYREHPADFARVVTGFIQGGN